MKDAFLGSWGMDAVQIVLGGCFSHDLATALAGVFSHVNSPDMVIKQRAQYLLVFEQILATAVDIRLVAVEFGGAAAAATFRAPESVAVD
jgi:hypothetical protein